ncbi:MAG: ATP cone domain-containing protein, partial [Oscillospiraceae bacterium]
MISKIKKRNGDIVDFKPEKITRAIFKAANAVGGNDWYRATKLTEQVYKMANEQVSGDIAEVERLQDIVEKVLIENGHAKTAKAFILYREKRRSARESNALIGETIDMFSNYLGDNDWRVKENANAPEFNAAFLKSSN